MSSECGWNTRRNVYLWIVGSRSLVRATVQLFNNFSFSPDARAATVLNTVYGNHRSPIDSVDPSSEPEFITVATKPLQLWPNQMRVLQLGALDLPVFAIQAAFGTGKTVIGALLAARIFSTQCSTVVVTTTTNTAVAQFTDTLLKLDEYKNLDVLRFVCDSALIEGTPSTPVDIHTILKRLATDFGHQMSAGDIHFCRKYKRGLEVLEKYLFDPDRALCSSEAEREEYRMAEREVSDVTIQVIRIMFEVRPPAVVCLPTASLLNAVSE
ncbi:hypothetical protein Q1695_014845 [Nippostrongylus brasiliensis]|nr:hypothetical protein Q1695_014845 [Nippostrongylus brasiliensis]